MNILINSVEKRLKAGWRILIFFMIFVGIALGLMSYIRILLGSIKKSELLHDYSVIVVIILAFSATITVPIVRKLLDKKSFVSLGLKFNLTAIKDIIFGFLLSGLMAGIIFLFMLVFGLIEVTDFNFGYSLGHTENSFNFVEFMSVITIGSLLILFLEMFLVGWWEELVFRGYLLQNMIEGLSFKAAIIISCLLYGLLHAMNPNATLISSIIIVLFGFLRIYGYILTKMLWLSIGMHIGWNFFQGPIFGYAASGHEKASLISQTAVGPNWLSGGSFGPEGSILIIPILFLAILIMRMWSNDRNKIEK